jgi:hypothetical protein
LNYLQLLAFGFGNLLIFWWLAAAGLPIVIHLWNKRKYREVPWAAIEYLLAALRKNSRRIQLEQWILLAIRTAIVALVVLAMAEPFLESAGLNFSSGQRTLKVLVIDGSYSMAYKPTDKTRFERAKQLAAQIVSESPQGDGFMLLLMGSPPSVIVGTPAMEPREFLEEIDNLKLPHAGADLPATLAKIEEVLPAADHTGLARREVYFLTDLGRNTWVPELGGAGAEAEFRERLARLADRASLVVLDLGQRATENLVVTSLRTPDPFAAVGREATLDADVRNFGTQFKGHQLVEFFVDGHRLKEAYVDVGPGEQSTVSFSYRFEAPGDHVVEARLGADLLDVDNHRWLTLPVKENLRVLCVDGKPAGGGLGGATDYLVLALDPERGEASGRELVKCDVIPESALSEHDLSRYDCVFLCNVGQFTGNEARLLDVYLQQGGGLVFFLGDQVLAERYNRELGGEQGVRLLPAQIGDLVAEAQYRFDPLDYRHPLVNAFSGREAAGLLTTPVYKYFRLKLPPDGAARVALAFEGGDPAIVEEPIHRGRVILVATEGSMSSIDPATKSPWTTMPAWPSYVPLVQEMLVLAVSGQARQRNVEVGQAIGDTVDSAAAQLPLSVSMPDGKHEDLRLSVDARGGRWSFGDTSQSGVYLAQLGNPVSREETFAVNVDTAESNLARLEPDELPKQFTTNLHSDLDDLSSAAVSRHSNLNKILLYTVLGLVFAETLLAWRFGHQQ